MNKSDKTDLKMTGIVVFVVVIFIALCGWLLYVNNNKPTDKITVGNNQQDVKIKVNQEFMIDLVSNPSTGYNWSVNETYDKSVVEFVGNVYIPADTDRSGAPGQDQWTFRGKSKGTTKLSLYYGRSWEKDSSLETVKNYNITVE